MGREVAAAESEDGGGSPLTPKELNAGPRPALRRRVRVAAATALGRCRLQVLPARQWARTAYACGRVRVCWASASSACPRPARTPAGGAAPLASSRGAFKFLLGHSLHSARTGPVDCRTEKVPVAVGPSWALSPLPGSTEPGSTEAAQRQHRAAAPTPPPTAVGQSPELCSVCCLAVARRHAAWQWGRPEDDLTARLPCQGAILGGNVAGRPHRQPAQSRAAVRARLTRPG